MEFYCVEGKPHNVKAIRSGERRPPKKGEYFLSGAIVTAYLAYENLTQVYHIARLVEVKQITTYQIKRYL